jgi:hypothetical protein
VVEDRYIWRKIDLKNLSPDIHQRGDCDGKNTIHTCEIVVFKTHSNLKGTQYREGYVRKPSTSCRRTSSAKGVKIMLYPIRNNHPNIANLTPTSG